MAELAKNTGISRQSLSLYAGGVNNPPYENVVKIANALSFPFEFFTSEDVCTTTTDNTFFRSQASASKLKQNAHKKKLEYVARIYEVLSNYVEFPKLNLPPVFFRGSEHLLETDSDEVLRHIEFVANSVRESWKIGSGPIDNIQYLLESNGIIVTGMRELDERVDAFSQKVNIQNFGPIFIIALSIGSKSHVRIRFDMAHELGHILMHDWTESNDNLSKDEFNALEKQANIFANAFLLPRDTFGKDVRPYATNIEYYRSLRKKWGVSMQAMMYRARQLEIISANQFQYMMRIVSARGWRQQEPGDVPGELNSTIFQGAIDVLFDGGYLNARQLMQAFHDYGIYLSENDLEDILCLKTNILRETTPEFAIVKPKNNLL